MARGTTPLVVMAVVGIRLLLGQTGGALSQEVTDERLRTADKDPHTWLLYDGTYKGWRYSPLPQINTTNVTRLVVTWQFQTGSGDEHFQVTPLVVDGVEIISLEQAAATLRACIDSAAQHGIGMWCLVPKTGDDLIGFCGFRFLPDATHIELLYGLAAAYWRQGLATEAARAALTYAFALYPVERIFAGANRANRNACLSPRQPSLLHH